MLNQVYTFMDKACRKNRVDQVFGPLLLHPSFTDVKASKLRIIKLKLHRGEKELIALALFVVVISVEVKVTSFETAE